MNFTLLALTASAWFAFEDPKPPALRLPETVVPTRYEAQLRLAPEENSFRGTIQIAVTAKEKTGVIWLHAAPDLKVESATLEQGGKTAEARVIRPEKSDFLGLVTPVEPGPGRLVVRYTARLETGDSNGVFRGLDRGNQYIYTQFEPIAARMAYPCFDEPRFKTPWRLTLTVKQEHLAFSNTMPESEQPAAADPGMKTIRFAETKPLPTYLLAFAVGPFEVADGGRAGRKKTPIRMIVPKGRLAEAAYAVEVTGRILTLLENYFDIPYPYEKLDQVAVPLFGGAMENPGLITYSDTLLLGRTDGADTIGRKRGYYETAAHEIAHQWFGDLVTMPWWNDLWLNESFATWMEKKITAIDNPGWKLDVQRVSEGLGVMAQDALVSARRIRQPVESNDDISLAFDGITYVKGGAVVQMLENWMGAENFRKGVHNYMVQHSYGSARSEDFLAALAKVKGGKDIPAAASSFIDQGGVPEVSLAVECKDGARPAVQLEQRRFLPLGSKASASAQLWKIPVCLQYGNANGSVERQCTLFGEKQMRVELAKAKSCPAWVLGNENMGGYYRTRYESSAYRKLMENGYSKLPLPVQVGLLSEAGAMAGAGVLSPEEALRAVESVRNAEDRSLVSAAMALTAQFGGAVLPEASRPAYTRFVQKNFGERARKLGWLHQPGDDDDVKLLRARLVGQVADLGRDAELQAKARELAQEYLKNPRALPAEMRQTILSTAASSGDRALFDAFLAAAKTAKDPRDRQMLISALGAFQDPALMDAAFDLFLKGGFDPRESYPLLLFGKAAKLRRAFSFVKDHLAEAEARMPADITGAKGAFLLSAAGGFCSAEGAEQTKALFGPRVASYTGGPRTLAQVVESIELCSARREAQEKKLTEFLSKY